MRRRTLLAAVASGVTGLAGCSNSGGPRETMTPAPVPTIGPDPTERPTDEPTGPQSNDRQDVADDEPTGPDNRANAVFLETVPLAFAFYPTRIQTYDRAHVTFWFEEGATADHPTLVRGVLENANDFETAIRIDTIPVVGQTVARRARESDPAARLYTAPTARNDIAAEVPSVERKDSGLWRVTDVGRWMPETRRFGAGERVSLEYALVDHPDATVPPSGTYDFQGRYENVSLGVWDTDDSSFDVE